MRHYRCDQCATIMACKGKPVACVGCGAGAAVAFPHGPMDDDDLISADSVEVMVDVDPRNMENAMETGKPSDESESSEEDKSDGLPSEGKASSGTESTIEGQEEEESVKQLPEDQQEQQTDGKESAQEDETLALASEEAGEEQGKVKDGQQEEKRCITLKLKAQDLEEVVDPPEEESPPEAEPAWNPLGMTTLELDEEDLEEASESLAKPPRPPPIRKSPQLARARKQVKSRWMLLIVAGAGVGLAVGIYMGLRNHEQRNSKNLIGSRTEQVKNVPITVTVADSAVDREEHQASSSDILSPDLVSPDQQITNKPRLVPRAKRPSVAGLEHRSKRAQPPRLRIPPSVTSTPEAPKRVTFASSRKKRAHKLYREGLTALLRGETQKAINTFNKILKVSRGFALAYRGLGLAYEKTGRKALARAAFQRYLVLNKGATDARLIKERIERLK